MPVAAVLLLADLYIGAATVGRLIDASNEDLHVVRGMNRIRHAYREMVPGLEPYFVTSFHDDARGVLAAYGDVTASDTVLTNVVHGLTTMVGMVATVVAMIVGALAALVVVGLGAGVEGALLAPPSAVSSSAQSSSRSSGCAGRWRTGEARVAIPSRTGGAR